MSFAKSPARRVRLASGIIEYAICMTAGRHQARITASLLDRSRDARGPTESNITGAIVGDMPSISREYCPIDSEIDRGAFRADDVMLLLFWAGAL